MLAMVRTLLNMLLIVCLLPSKFVNLARHDCAGLACDCYSILEDHKIVKELLQALARYTIRISTKDRRSSSNGEGRKEDLSHEMVNEWIT